MNRLLVAALLLVALTGCGGGDVAVDPGDSGGPGPMPTAVPAAPGEVRSRGLVTVMDTGRPELCLGAIAESYPPQCGGPPITNWDWSQHRGTFTKVDAVRWGEYAVTGRFDGTSFEVTDALPAALYDAPQIIPTPNPTPAREYSDAELARIQQELQGLAGSGGGYVSEGHVLVDVLYDDGSLQDWVDAAYGTNVVIVTSQLVDVG